MNFLQTFSILFIFKSILSSCSDIDDKTISFSAIEDSVEYLPSEETKDDRISHESQVQVSPPSKSRNIFEYLPADICFLIGSYFKNPVAKLGSINKNLFGIFHNEFSLKYFVHRKFYIPELKCAEENEPELAGILNWCISSRSRHLALFGSLMEDIGSGKKPYKVLFRPLIHYLARTFKTSDLELQQKYTQYLIRKESSFEGNLGRICAENGHFDLAFEFLQNNPENLLRYLSEVKNRAELNNFFKSNRTLAFHYERALIILFADVSADRINDILINYELTYLNASESALIMYVLKWIGECIIYDMPEEFYTEILRVAPDILKKHD